MMKPGPGFQHGVTLIELITFIVIVSIAAVALLGSYASILPYSPTPAQVTQATQLAQERMEVIVGQKPILGYSSLSLDPWGVQPGNNPAVTGYNLTVTGANVIIGWPTDTAPNRLLNRQITVTLAGPGGINLQYVTVLSNY